MMLFGLPVSRLQVYRLSFHIIALSLVLFGPFFLIRPETDLPRPLPVMNFTPRWAVISLAIVLLYFINVYFYIPKFLKQGKYILYVAVLVLSMATVNFILNELLHHISPPLRTIGMRLSGSGIGVSTPVVTRLIVFPVMLPLVLGISFEMILNWEIQRKEKIRVEREKMASELVFLKSQINPHFFFNSLNSIYALAEKQSQRTGEAILILSDLMRYTLYGSNDGKIYLCNEIRAIENYIALQKMRMSSKEDIDICFNATGEESKVMIEPLLLLPFIENAFKHGVSYNQRSEVLIDLLVANDAIELYVRNTKKLNLSEENRVNGDSGIGLVNIKRRLNLLYPSRHTLVINDLIDLFEVRLKILP